MKKYSYQILRFLPDRMTGEFINVGLAIFCKEEQYLRCSTISNVARVKNQFPSIDSRVLKTKLKDISNCINKIGLDTTREGPIEFQALREITSFALPIDDSALFFTEEKIGVDLVLQDAFEYLYDNMIVTDVSEKPNYATDRKVWKNIYKSYFEKYGLDQNLKKRSVKTSGDEINFDYAIQNGKWNYIEPVTFSLSNEDNVKDKVYKWIGRLHELDKSQEKFKLYLLSEMPSNRKLRNFVMDRLSEVTSDNYELELVEPKNADLKIAQLKTDIESEH